VILMDQWEKARQGFIESRDVPLYVLRKTKVRVSVRQCRQWLLNGAILRLFPRHYKVTSNKYIFTTEKQIDKFLKRMEHATKFKNSAYGYRGRLFDRVRRKGFR